MIIIIQCTLNSHCISTITVSFSTNVLFPLVRTAEHWYSPPFDSLSGLNVNTDTTDIKAGAIVVTETVDALRGSSFSWYH